MADGSRILISAIVGAITVSLLGSLPAPEHLGSAAVGLTMAGFVFVGIVAGLFVYRILGRHHG